MVGIVQQITSGKWTTITFCSASCEACNYTCYHCSHPTFSGLVVWKSDKSIPRMEAL